MCECGCAGNHDRYLFPAPNRGLYVLTIAGHCLNCDGGSGISIELIEPSNSMYREYKRGDWTNGKLKFDDWGDSKGVSIVCGKQRHEFIHDCLKHLVGIDCVDMGSGGGQIDEAGADVILEEMYEDAQLKPFIIRGGKRTAV